MFSLVATFMILSMKIISFSFDVDNGVIVEYRDVIKYIGYVFCPSSIIFGPFMMYKDYSQILQHHPMVRKATRSLISIFILYPYFPVFVEMNKLK